MYGCSVSVVREFTGSFKLVLFCEYYVFRFFKVFCELFFSDLCLCGRDGRSGYVNDSV